MKKLYLPILAIFFVLASLQSFARLTEDQINKAWLNAGYSDRMLIVNVMNQETCYSTEEDFKGCVQALNTFKSALLKKYTEVFPKDTPMSTKIDFTDEVTKISAGGWSQEQLAFAAGNAINRFFAVAYDPHSYEMPWVLFEEQMNGSGNKYVGVGIVYAIKEDQVLVQSVLEGSGAKKAGMKVGDQIVSVNDEPVDVLQDTMSKVVGEEGTTVNVTVLRSNKKINLKITRTLIEIKNVTSTLFQDNNKRTWGLIKLNSFLEEQTCYDFIQEYLKLYNKKIKGLIWDLRDNGGGNIQQAQCILSAILPPEKQIVSVQDIETFETLEEASLYTKPISVSGISHSSEPLLIDIPVVVLVNSGSASASELSAGALQDYSRAWVVGEQSFGKGTIQDIKRTNNGVVARADTFGRFHLPSGRSNQRVGITPDFEVLTESNSYPREVDLFPNTAPAYTEHQGAARLPSKKLNKCVKNNSVSYKSDKNGKVKVDPMVATAISVLSCESH